MRADPTAQTASAASAETDDPRNGTRSTPCSDPVYITKDNIDSFNYFQLFDLTVPATSGGKLTTSNDGSAAFEVDVGAVRRLYRRLSLRFHPDKDDSDAARHAFGVVHAALETMIDSEKRAAYLKDLINSSKDKGGGGESEEEVRQRYRAQQAQEEAQWAAEVLAQREQERQTREAAAQKAAAEREEAAQRLLSELTGSLHTPYQQMEAELVREWDVDEEMVLTKTQEVMKLLSQLTPTDGLWEDHASGEDVRGGVDSLRKRGREETTI